MTTRTWLRVDALLRRVRRLRHATAYQRAVLPYVGVAPDTQDWEAQWARQWQLLRRRSLDTWLAIRRSRSTDFTPYYQEPYFLLRGVWHRRDDSFHAILATMRAESGFLLDYGCGAGMVADWLHRRRPHWSMQLVDVPGPAFAYACRKRPGAAMLPKGPEQFAREAWPPFEVTVCLDTLEHLARPHDVLLMLLRRTVVGGHLFLSMSPDRDGENIGAPYRCDVLALLARYCETRLSMDATDQYGHYVKLEEP